MQSTKELLGLNIKHIREKRDIIQADLAEKIGVEPNQVSRIETGNSFPSCETLEKIAIALDVELKDLFTFRKNFEHKDCIARINTILSRVPQEKLNLILNITENIYNA